MAIDQVHDLQFVFRNVLHSMSRPGTISSLQSATQKVEHALPCYDATLLCVLTLLDTEVTFHVLSDGNDDLKAKVSEYTLAKHVPVTEADFIIALRGNDEMKLLHAMSNCKIGTLVNPEQSATWIVESSSVVNEGELVLQGPGIEASASLHTDFTRTLWEARNERTKEYPLGVDLLFADEGAHIVSVPRTTSVQVREVE